jgi:glycosyltransferase involved in cell wall biosynthesis
MVEPFYDRLLYRLASRIIAISNAVAGRFPYDMSKKVSVIYNGVDTDSFTSIDKSELPGRLQFNGKVVIGQVGQIHPLKGLTSMIQALDKVRNVCPDIQCIIVGDFNDYQKDLAKMVHDLGLESHLTFAGWHDNIREVMSALDILIVPSLTEAFGRVIIEAMACSRPVVAFSVDAIPEVVENHVTGILGSKGDLDGLKQALIELIVNPVKREEMGRMGRRRVEGLFRMDEHVRKIQHVYEEVLT